MEVLKGEVDVLGLGGGYGGRWGVYCGENVGGERGI